MKCKSVAIMLISFILFMTIYSQPVHAGLRPFVWFLFFSGLGSSTAGAILQGQANEAYDRYLHTAIQSEMEKFVDDYESKHKQSIIASRTGLGIVIGAIFLSLVDAAHIPPPEVEKTPSLFGLNFKPRDGRNINTYNQDSGVILEIGGKF